MSTDSVELLRDIRDHLDDPEYIKLLRPEIEKALSASPIEAPVQDMVMVPRNATPEMLGAWYRYKSGHHFANEEPPGDTSDVGAYRAMIDAFLKGAPNAGK